MIRIHSAAVSLICQLLALVCFALSFVVKNQRIKDLMQAILWLSIWRNQCVSSLLESYRIRRRYPVWHTLMSAGAVCTTFASFIAWEPVVANEPASRRLVWIVAIHFFAFYTCVELWCSDCDRLSDELESLVRRLQSEKITVEEYERQKAASLGDFKSLYGTWGGEDVLAAEEARLKASLKADV